ncbi:CTP synthase [Hydrogenimonas sp.]|nr:CTP synthase [Hydrogenimonas sp.]
MTEAPIHAGAAPDTKINIRWVDSEDIEEKGIEETIGDVDGILVAGDRRSGVSREDRGYTPCQSQQDSLPRHLSSELSIIEFSRNVLGLEGQTP